MTMLLLSFPPNRNTHTMAWYGAAACAFAAWIPSVLRLPARAAADRPPVWRRNLRRVMFMLASNLVVVRRSEQEDGHPRTSRGVGGGNRGHCGDDERLRSRRRLAGRH